MDTPNRPVAVPGQDREKWIPLVIEAPVRVAPFPRELHSRVPRADPTVYWPFVHACIPVAWVLAIHGA